MKSGDNLAIYTLAGLMLILLVIVALMPKLFTNSGFASVNNSALIISEEIPVDDIEDVDMEDYWIYYVNKNDKKIYRMEVDGTNSNLILDINAEYFSIKMIMCTTPMKKTAITVKYV